MLKIGNQTINKLYLGSTEIKKVYLGNTLVYDKTAPIPIETELQATIDRIAVNGWNAFTPTIENALNLFIGEMKSSGLWSKTKVTRFKSFNNTTLQNALRINLKNPNGDLATLHGGFTVTNNGIKYNGVNSYTNEKFNPTTAGLSIDNWAVAHHFQDDFSANAGKLCGISANTPTRRIGLFPNYTEVLGLPQAVAYSNDLASNGVQSTSKNRLITYGRNLTVKTLHINEIYQEFPSAALSPLLNFDYFTGALNDRNTAKFFCDGTDSFFWAGEWLSEEEANNLRTIVNNFYTRTSQTLIP